MRADHHIVSFGLVQTVAVHGGTVQILLRMGHLPPDVQQAIVEQVRHGVGGLPGVRAVEVRLTPTGPRRMGASPRPTERPSFLAPGSRTVIVPVASGKGGVGKSTVTVNLAVALARCGQRVGVIDADVYGFSIPRMLGIHGSPEVAGQKIVPLERAGVRVISIGVLVGSHDPVIWRGPLLHKTLTTFIRQVAWGELDYLLLDLPPGTGDVSLTIAQELPGARMVIVTTPQEAAVEVAIRAARMAEKVNMEVAGVVENMSASSRSREGRRSLSLVGEAGGGSRPSSAPRCWPRSRWTPGFGKGATGESPSSSRIPRFAEHARAITEGGEGDPRPS